MRKFDEAKYTILVFLGNKNTGIPSLSELPVSMEIVKNSDIKLVHVKSGSILFKQYDISEDVKQEVVVIESNGGKKIA